MPTTPPPVQAMYSGTPVQVADGAGEALPFTNLDSGTELLNRTDPANPKVLAAGVYALSACAASTEALTAGGTAVVSLALSSPECPTSVGATPRPDYAFGATVIGKLAAGDPLSVTAFNLDGAAARSYFLLPTTLVKLA